MFWDNFWPNFVSDLAVGVLIATVLLPFVLSRINRAAAEIVGLYQAEGDVTHITFRLTNTGKVTFDSADISCHVHIAASLSPELEGKTRPNMEKCVSVGGVSRDYFDISTKTDAPLFPNTKLDLFTVKVNTTALPPKAFCYYLLTKFGPMPKHSLRVRIAQASKVAKGASTDKRERISNIMKNHMLAPVKLAPKKDLTLYL